MGTLKIVHSIIKDGIMSSDEEFYRELSQEEREEKFKEHQRNFLKRIELEDYKIVIPTQKTIFKQQDESFSYEDGKYEVLTKEVLQKYQEDYKNTLHTDIVIMRSDIKNVILADKVADCPILILYAKEKNAQEILAFAHCGAEYINRKLPQQMVEALKKETNTPVEEWDVYIGPCISKESYEYDKYPLWATDKEVWKQYIEKRENIYFIDLRGAIIEQLLKSGLKKEKIKIDEKDTKKDPTLFSNRAGKLENSKKNGRFLVGAYFYS